MRQGAVVTGASRGIGKACAIELARAGFDVVITARTVRRSDATWDPDGLSDRPLPGSLEETAEAIEDVGGRAHLVPLDLGERDRLVPAARDAIAALRRVDVLVNNAVAVVPGGHQRFLEADMSDIEDRVFGNLTAQLYFSQPIVAHMVEQGGGVVLNMTSAAGYLKPFASPHDGGWSLSYSVAKGGFHRIAPQLNFEYGDAGIIALNVQPGMVATERVKQVAGPVSSIADRGVEPEVIGRAVSHVARHARDFDPLRTIQLQDLTPDER